MWQVHKTRFFALINISFNLNQKVGILYRDICIKILTKVFIDCLCLKFVHCLIVETFQVWQRHFILLGHDT